MGEGVDGGHDVTEFGTHASAVVHYQSHGYRSIFLFEDREFLHLPIFINVEILPLETCDEYSPSVGNIDR